MPPKRVRGADPAEDEPMEDAAARAVAADGDDDDDSDSDDSDDSDDASSSDSDAELDMPDESTMDRIMKLERVVAETPARYNAHVALIRELRGAKLRERARRAREAFAGSFALNESQWREWIADEVTDAKGKKKTQMREMVGPLFERAVRDTPGSVSLWLGYFEFSMDQDWESEPRRALYERALECAGADFRDGGKLFAARRAFESSRHAVDGDDRAKVASRVRELFRRQLALPHARIYETARQAEAWEAEMDETKPETETETERGTSDPVLTPAARAAHAVAVAVAERRRPLEEAVAAAEALPDGTDRADEAGAREGEADEKRRRRRRAAREAHAAALTAAHRASVAAAESEFETDVSGMRADVKLATVASAYERALAVLPADEALWRAYTSRLERSAAGRVAADAHARAIRHCPGSGETFACALRWQCARGAHDAARKELETVRRKFGDSPRDAHAALAAAARVGLIGAEQALARLSEIASENGEGWLDPDLTLLRQSVRSRADTASQRRLWDDFAETRFKNVAEVHVARATFLADALGDDAAASAAFKKAFAKIDALTSVCADRAGFTRTSTALESPGALVLCRAWMAFERSRGCPGAGGANLSGNPSASLSENLSLSFLEADARAGARLRAVEAARAARAAKAADPEEAKRLRRANDPNYSAKGENSRGARKRPADARDLDPADRLSPAAPAAKKPRGGDDVDETRTDSAPAAPRLPRDPAARAAKYEELFPDRDSRTAFVRNVPFQCTERELELFFEAPRGDAVDDSAASARGGVTARVVMDKATGKPRGFAYVEFASEKALRAAVMRDGETFQGRKLSIAVSLPPGKEKPEPRLGAKAFGKIQKPDPGRRAPRGLGFGGGMTPRATRPAVAAAGEDVERPKSNADFRAELLKGFRKSEGT